MLNLTLSSTILLTDKMQFNSNVCTNLHHETPFHTVYGIADSTGHRGYYL